MSQYSHLIFISLNWKIVKMGGLKFGAQIAQAFLMDVSELWKHSLD